MLSRAFCPNIENDYCQPLDLSVSSQVYISKHKRQPSQAVNKRRATASSQVEKKACQWSVPNLPELKQAVDAASASDKFANISAHLNYSSGMDGLKCVANHLKDNAGRNYQAFLNAAASFDQAAVQQTA